MICTFTDVPSFRFLVRGTSECTLVPVLGTGEHPNVPSFRFGYRGTSAKTTLLQNHPFANLSILAILKVVLPLVFLKREGILQCSRECLQSSRKSQQHSQNYIFTCPVPRQKFFGGLTHKTPSDESRPGPAETQLAKRVLSKAVPSALKITILTVFLSVREWSQKLRFL